MLSLFSYIPPSSLGELSVHDLVNIVPGVRLTGQSLRDLLVDNDPDLNAPLGGSLEHVVQPVLLIASGRSAKIQLRAQPPVQNIDALAGS